jgi:hypothetical protein
MKDNAEGIKDEGVATILPTVLRRRRASGSSVALPWHASCASARARSCHSGRAASNIRHQMMVTAVVSCPAK